MSDQESRATHPKEPPPCLKFPILWLPILAFSATAYTPALPFWLWFWIENQNRIRKWQRGVWLVCGIYVCKFSGALGLGFNSRWEFDFVFWENRKWNLFERAEGSGFLQVGDILKLRVAPHDWIITLSFVTFFLIAFCDFFLFLHKFPFSNFGWVI